MLDDLLAVLLPLIGFISVGIVVANHILKSNTTRDNDIQIESVETNLNNDDIGVDDILSSDEFIKCPSSNGTSFATTSFSENMVGYITFFDTSPFFDD